MLPVPDAVRLFTRTAARVSGPSSEPPELLREAVELCGRMPLAIRIAGARLRSHPSWRLADLIARLEGGRRLAELAGGAGDVSTAIEVSYRQLAPAQQLCYRRLGLHPGSEFEPYATAALLDQDVTGARRLLEHLLDVHLLQEPAPERYVFHDLVRDHAVRTAAGAQRGWRGRRRDREALIRLLDHHRHAASVAMDAAHPYERERRPRVPPSRTPLPDLSALDRATRWLDAELANLLAAAGWAAGNGLPGHTWQLPAIISRHLRTRGRYEDAEDLYQRGLSAARAGGNRAGEFAMLIGLGWARLLLSRYHAAAADFHLALETASAAGDRLGEADALAGLGRVHLDAGRYEQAVDSYGRTLEIAHSAADRTGELNALRGLGFVNLLRGRYKQALDDYGRTLEIARATGNRIGELNALAILGETHRLLGEFDLARRSFGSSLEMAELMGDLAGEVGALVGLAHIDRLHGLLPEALAGYQRAYEIAKATGDRIGEASTLLGLGVVHRRQGRYDEAARLFRRVLTRAVEAGDRNVQFEALQYLGRLHHAAGDQHEAIATHRRALDLATELDSPADQARAHDGLARAHLVLGQPAPAREHWQSALRLLTDLGTDHTEDEEANTATIRANLADLGED
jgi:tetratricopeptide (TPR) repeat protein